MTREKAIKLIGGMKSDLSDFYDYDDLTALDMAISALSAKGEKKCSKCIHSAEQDGEFCYECIKGNEDNFVSAEGEYIKKEETAEYVDSYIQEINTGYGDVNSHTNRILRMISDGIRKMDSYSFPNREKGTDGTLVYNVGGHFYGVMGGDAIMERMGGKADEIDN